jgi:hypothetical protein
MRMCMEAQFACGAITRARLGSANATASWEITVMEQFLINISLSLPLSQTGGRVRIELGIWQI